MIEHAALRSLLVDLGVRDVGGAVDPGSKREFAPVQNPLTLRMPVSTSVDQRRAGLWGKSARYMNSIIHYRLVVLALATGFGSLAIFGTVGNAQDAPTEAQQQEYVSLATIVGAALQGQIVPTEEPFGWANDFLKSGERTTFVPFTLSIDRTKLSTPSVAMYIFVAKRGATATVGVNDALAELPMPAFEDAYHVDLGAPTLDGFYEVRRGFWAPAGDYDIYVAMSESDVADGSEARTMMLKKQLSIPNMWSNQLATSTVIMAARIEALNELPAPDPQLTNPYTLGTMRIVPKMSTDYLTSEDLSMVFLVYNVGLAESGLPDVHVEYTFNRRGPSGDEFFNRTSPQAFNEQTLPPEFNMAAGHQLVAGQTVPLSAFPAADYRLEITVTDQTNGRSLTHNVDFTVSES